jgi:hypothetical protein
MWGGSASRSGAGSRWTARNRLLTVDFKAPLHDLPGRFAIEFSRFVRD